MTEKNKIERSEKIAPDVYEMVLLSQCELSTEKQIVFHFRSRTIRELMALEDAFERIKSLQINAPAKQLFDICEPLLASHLVRVEKAGKELSTDLAGILNLAQLGELTGQLCKVEHLTTEAKKNLRSLLPMLLGKFAEARAKAVQESQERPTAQSSDSIVPDATDPDAMNVTDKAGTA